MLSPLLVHALDWLYPPLCTLCGAALRGGCHLCADCAGRLPRQGKNACRRCGQNFDGPLSAPESCPNCRQEDQFFNFATAALRSSDEAIQLIHEFKLLKRPELGPDLARLAGPVFTSDQRLRDLDDPLLIPVPLHRTRLRERRFNQAEVLATALARDLGLRSLSALARVRATQRQATLTRRERLKNLRKAFHLRNSPIPLEGRALILIDDVFTTGSTARECARVLRKARPSHLAVLTIVRA
ncbi:ComF family protein [Roseibacillus ishigakijimensis]|uniref:ComF family protein n=1 Tax=Roseibacillus ishigakijimensis TaxID=454146 RepID=A0A934VHB0_9BACT|nr:ComF family protein [Roseibacillus ishigakijimensis]MBK1833748.1 ComF family protein [Roseibacillus ishigakijimensis]